MAKSKVTTGKKPATSKKPATGKKSAKKLIQAKAAGKKAAPAEGAKAGKAAPKRALRTVKVPPFQGTITFEQAREAVRAVMAMRREQAAAESEAD